ncbi:MAG: glycosyl transferase [Alphaproteobacteria bacterium]|nr:glycosyl transferase [Alphaproteobacteria bacterium]
MIPKKIHYCWFGPRPKGEVELKCIESWKKILPDYEIREWTDADLAGLDNRYLKQAVKAKKWAFVSDYVRLHALLNEGGIYFDTDEEIRKPLDDFMNFDFFIGSQKCGSCRDISPALIGTVPDSPIVRDLISVYDDIDFVRPDGSFNLTTNPMYFTRVLKEKYGVADTFVTKERVKITENAYIYPYYYFCTDNPDAYAVHHYTGSWKPDWNVRDKLSVPLGKGRKLILRKYKKNRDGSEMPFAEDEKTLCSLKTSGRSTLFLLVKGKR